MQNLYCRTRVVLRVFPHILSADVCARSVYSVSCEKQKDTLIAFDGLACFLGTFLLFLMNRDEQHESLSLCAFRCIPSEKFRKLSS